MNRPDALDVNPPDSGGNGQGESIIDSNTKPQGATPDAMERENQALQEECAALKSRVRELQMELDNKQGQLDLLRESDRKLRRIERSALWKTASGAKRFAGAIAPENSKRRLFLKLIARFLRHPIVFFRKLDVVHMKRFAEGMKSGSLSSLSDRLDNYLGGGAIPVEPPEQFPVVEYANIEDVPKLRVPMALNPVVSIVVPAYNQFAYTYACLKSIAKNSGDVSYEVIIADDCSTDLTRQIDRAVTGIRVVRNAENLRFLLNCNHAAEEARGKYILFLNNDTQVTWGWLRALVELIERDEKIGMVGSKLIYPDGRLQEAGGILWKDGSAWNYGHLADPSRPEYNYVKEADYISGAAIMIRAELWRQLGGFDERFAPAYCEDSDLAFQVRRAGYMVLYQPKSVVIHFEGVSNGTDTSSGLKAYQVTNTEKFHEKWKAVLESEHNPNAVDVFRARDRSLRRKTLLVVDHYVPMFDKDAGSRYMLHYIRLFVNKGYNVKFMGDNFYPHQPYTETLQQMGVEVIYGNWYAQHWKEWLKEIGQDLDYVLLSRPHISVKYIDAVRKLTRAKVFYMVHDLHFWREEMRYEKTGEADALKESKKWKEIEFKLMRDCDVSITPSSLEVEKIASIDPSITARRWPINIYESVPNANYDASGRRDILFIGGFTHEPNVDAALWAAEQIMPLVWKERPELKLHIVGSNAPEQVLALGNERVTVHGYLSDEELNALYRDCRMELVPLRYGGGVKGKVIEAMYHGLPIVTTSVGTQGINGADEFLMMGETAEALAEQIIKHYDDAALLANISKKETDYVRTNFSEAEAVKVVALDFDFGDMGA